MNLSIVKVAVSQIGVKEIVGAVHNKTIVQYAQDIGATWIKDDETPWCAIFINWVLKQAGYPYTAKANARSFETYGVKTIAPEPGDIVVFWRGSLESGQGHVGIYMGHTEYDRIYVCGGNQGNQVNITKYGTERILGYRRVSEASVNLEIPPSVLKVGSKGKDVSNLQEVLKFLELYSIKVDGDYGEGTKKAVTAFQTVHKLPVTGIYDKLTEAKLFTILNE